MTKITKGNLYTAACLWEAAMEATIKGENETEGFNHDLFRYREDTGSHTLRDKVALMAPACDRKWDSMSDDEREEQQCFDWVFCPNWLAENFFKLESEV